MLPIGNANITFNPNYPGIIAVTSTLVAFSSILTDVVNENSVVSIKNVTWVALSVGSWSYTLATKPSKVFEKTITPNLAQKNLAAEQKFNNAFKNWTLAKKNIQDIKALSRSGDIADESILSEEIENFNNLEDELRTLFNGLSKSQQESYRGLSFLTFKDWDE